MTERSSATPIHPILFAAFPSLFLFSQNAIQQVNLDPLWVPLAVSVAAGTLLFALLAAVFRDPMRGAVAASLILLAFFSFGHATRLLSLDPGGRTWLAIAYAALMAVGLVAVWRGGAWITAATRFLNLAGMVLVAINAVGVIGFAIGISRVGGLEGVQPIVTDATPDHRPDVYYLVFDRYASADTLQRVYGFDNGSFLGELETRGFSVANESWANYLKTAFSLVSSLNADYLDVDQLDDADASSFAPIHLALRGRLAVPATLKELGYEYVHIGNYWEPGATNIDADRAIRYGSESEFASALLATTAVSLAQPISVADDDPETIESPALARGHSLFEFDAIEEAASRPGPTYVFAHLLLPHPPYVFDTDGSEPTAEETQTRSVEEAYVAQLEWTNDRILEMVDRLLDTAEGEEPIVILQADEGPFPERFAENQAEFDWLTATADEVAQKFGILMAVHLPTGQATASGFTDSTSPVNVWRVVLNAEFGADLPMLPDQTFLTPDYHHLTTFVPYERPAP